MTQCEMTEAYLQLLSESLIDGTELTDGWPQNLLFLERAIVIDADRRHNSLLFSAITPHDPTTQAIVEFILK